MKRVLVTGGTVRLGAVIAEALRSRGWRVVTSSHRADSDADVIADLSVPGGAARLFSEAVEKAEGAFDAIVNNAALFTGDPDALESVNLLAPCALARLLAEQSGDSPRVVVNMLDTRVLKPGAADDDYSRSKRGLLEATRRLARELAPHVRVNAVAPGPVLAPVDVHEKAGRLLLAGRPRPEDVADAVAYLLEARSTTGAVVPVDSGQHLVQGGFRQD